MKYSRRASVEEQKNIRTAVVLIILTIAAALFLFTFGLPSIAGVATFFTDLTKSGKPIEITDKTPPAPPKFDSLPERTNEATITISGSAEPGATVTITLNNQTVDIVAGSGGKFSVSQGLWKGENSLRAVAKDTAGNTSQETSIIKIIFDKEVPKIDITAPTDGTTFYGSRQKVVTITGITKSGSGLLVNGRFVNVNEDGTFSYDFTLSEGANQLNFKATDSAGNTGEKSLTLHYSP